MGFLGAALAAEIASSGYLTGAWLMCTNQGYLLYMSHKAYP